MDECGIHAQVLFPNAVGLGGHRLNTEVKDEALRLLCVEIYNDAMAEIQEESNLRFLPMPVMPAWDVDQCVKETERCAGLGLRGINMTSDPQDLGSPDLASRGWDPFWEVCADLHMPVHFHIGSSNTAMDFYGNYFWASQDEYVKPAIGGAMLFLNSARVVINTVFAGIFDRFPALQMVAVESGVGWIPFILETMNYELLENAPRARGRAVEAAVGVLPGRTGTRPSGSRSTRATSRVCSTRSATTASCSRPTSPTRRASTRRRSKRWPTRCARCARRLGGGSWARTQPASTGCRRSPGQRGAR